MPQKLQLCIISNSLSEGITYKLYSGLIHSYNIYLKKKIHQEMYHMNNWFGGVWKETEKDVNMGRKNQNSFA